MGGKVITTPRQNQVRLPVHLVKEQENCPLTRLARQFGWSGFGTRNRSHLCLGCAAIKVVVIESTLNGRFRQCHRIFTLSQLKRFNRLPDVVESDSLPHVPKPRTDASR